MTRRRRLRLLAAVTGAALLTAAHLRVEAAGPGFEGPLLVVDHLYQIVVVGALGALCLAVGDRLMAVFGLEDSGPVDWLLASVLLGAGTVALALLAVGLAGVLSRLVVLGVLALAAWWAREGLARTPGLVLQALRRVPTPVLVVTGIAGAVLLLPALAPPTDWDSLMYHLRIPDLFLAEGRVFLPADNLHVAFVGLVHMLYLPLLAFGGSSAPALLSLAAALLLPLAVYRLGHRVFGSVTGEVAGVAIWGTATVALVASSARVDVTTALFLTVAHVAVYDALAADGGRRRLLLAAALLGLAVGVKYQAAAYAVALLPLVAWTALEDDVRPAVGTKHVVLFALVLLAASAPWFVKNWVLLDAPFYPFLADRLLPPWLADLHGVHSVPGSVGPEVFGALRDVRRPFDVAAAFLAPERLSVEGEAAHYHLSPLLLVLPLWVLWIRDRGLARVAGPALIYLALVLAASPRTNLRYLVPALPALTVSASALAVRSLAFASARLGVGGAGGGTGDDAAGPGSGAPAEEGGARAVVRAAALAAGIASLIPAGASLVAWLPGTASPAYAVGAQSRMDHIGERRSPAMVAHAGLTDFGERPLPDDARVLMLFEARGYYMTVPALQDNDLTNWSLLAPLRDRLDCLRATDVTHVLVGTGVLQYYFRRGLAPETVRWPEFRAFADRCLEEVLEVPGFVLYRVPTEGAGGSPGSDGPTSSASVPGREAVAVFGVSGPRDAVRTGPGRTAKGARP